MSLTRLADGLEELASFLERCGDRPWPSILRQLRVEATRTDPTDKVDLKQLAARVRPLFGGMGSLNDLSLTQANGHTLPDAGAANSHLEAQIDALYEAFVGICDAAGVKP